MRKEFNKTNRKRFETDEFYEINNVIKWLNKIKTKGANYIDFTGYSNVVKCRAMYLSPDDNHIMNDNDVVD
jgi:hypothetical protein